MGSWITCQHVPVGSSQFFKKLSMRRSYYLSSWSMLIPYKIIFLFTILNLNGYQYIDRVIPASYQYVDINPNGATLVRDSRRKYGALGPHWHHDLIWRLWLYVMLLFFCTFCKDPDMIWYDFWVFFYCVITENAQIYSSPGVCRTNNVRWNRSFDSVEEYTLVLSRRGRHVVRRNRIKLSSLDDSIQGRNTRIDAELSSRNNGARNICNWFICFSHWIYYDVI